jgi:pilus assembly protein CpaE
VASTVLIVDDSQTFVPELRGLLESNGYEVLAALRAEDALDMLGAARVDLIVTEALLPGMDGFQFVRQVRDRPATADIPVIMLSVRSAPEDYVAGFEAGANEYFVKPSEPQKLLAATKGLISRYEHGRLVRAPAAPAQVPLHRRSEQGEIITLFSLKGGVGTSTIAVNLAVSLKLLMPSARIGLIDLSLEEGIDALMLDIVPTSSIVEWSREEGPDAPPDRLYQYFVHHSSGISLLAAPTAPEDAEFVRPDIVRRTLELAQKVFDYVVVDTSSSFSEASLIALELAQTIVVPVTPDMASLKTAVDTTRILKAVRIEDSKIRFVLNEIIPRAGLPKEKVEGSLRKEVFIIPHAGPDFVEAVNHGTPLASLPTPPPAARAVMDLAATLCEPEVTPGAQAKQTSGSEGLRTVVERLGRLRRT